MNSFSVDFIRIQHLQGKRRGFAACVNREMRECDLDGFRIKALLDTLHDAVFQIEKLCFFEPDTEHEIDGRGTEILKDDNWLRFVQAVQIEFFHNLEALLNIHTAKPGEGECPADQPAERLLHGIRNPASAVCLGRGFRAVIHRAHLILPVKADPHRSSQSVLIISVNALN